MSVFNIRNLKFKYKNSAVGALKNFSLDIEKGEFLLICGHSGCGKTTLIRLLKSIASPYGEKSGDIYYKGTPIDEVDTRTQSAEIGYVFQKPDMQIVTDKVWHELAFGLESLGYDTPTIRVRVAEMASFFGIQDWFYKPVSELSGGQKQLLNLASIMVMRPEVILLDEPTSQLDPIARQELLDTLIRINRELGTTIIMSEHRLEEIMYVADRVVVMKEGEILTEGKPQRVGAYLNSINEPMFLAMPTPMRIFQEVEGGENSPMTIGEGKTWLEKTLGGETITLPFREDKFTGEYAITAKEAWFKYEKTTPEVIKGLDLNIRRGEIYSIVGGNGVGKSTALSLIVGINKPYRGKVKVLEGLSIGLLPQDPQLMFVKSTVYEDLKANCNDKDNIANIASLCSIENLLERHLYDLSGGEQQRVALAKILLNKPDILLLDEPTKGIDESFKIVFGKIISELKEKGLTIVIVSHDIEFCASYSDRCGMFFDGSIVMEEESHKFFAGNRFYTTATNRMCVDSIINAVTIDEALACLKNRNIKREPIKIDNNKTPLKEFEKKEENKPTTNNKGINKRFILSLFMIALVIPILIFFGIWVLDDRKYYFISMMIIICTILPFTMVFEKRQPQARELVVIAVVCTIGVLSRMICFMLPQCKPIIAIIIMSAACLGAESGFMIGALIGFVSNFFFGQGPWTPWQMFSLGIIGFSAGLLFKKVRNKYIIALFGGVATVLIYGGIMNPASVLMYNATPNLNMILFSYATGFIWDTIHAVSTVVFILILAKPFMEKLDRVKLKYGILGG